jgi:hypothetical protein
MSVSLFGGVSFWRFFFGLRNDTPRLPTYLHLPARGSELAGCNLCIKRATVGILLLQSNRRCIIRYSERPVLSGLASQSGTLERASIQSDIVLSSTARLRQNSCLHNAAAPIHLGEATSAARKQKKS